MSNIKRFSSRKEVTEVLKEKGIDTSNWSEEKWLKLNKGLAEIHMMDLAENIWEATNESTPKLLQPGEWHIPFEDKINDEDILNDISLHDDMLDIYKVQISTAMGARTSYTVVGEEKEINLETLIGLHDRLIVQQPPHSSPMEHCCKAMTEEEYYSFVKGKIEHNDKDKDGNYGSLDWSKSAGWCTNIKGFIPYRYLLDNNLTL